MTHKELVEIAHKWVLKNGSCSAKHLSHLCVIQDEQKIKDFK